MAETSALPTGFGELEVLAVGMVLLVEALSGLSLNTLTIFSFCKTPELRTPCHLLVLSLALADSGISLNALIAATSSLLRRWPYGSDGCQAHGFQGFVTALASICSSAAIAWGRYHHYCTQTSPASSSPCPSSTLPCPSSSRSRPTVSWSRNWGRAVISRCPPSLPKWCLQSMPSTMPWAMKWSAGGSGSASHHRRARRTEPSEPTILD
ncbi:RPE-retinal G protein-coupled receptor isoform X4 [Macaca fascicularis]|uniref:RPE-retinal G protein-coupled receptor isoform X4 n=1 Tax=Macaca fascicularis TaxID=9541 RepID=UPI003D156DFC